MTDDLRGRENAPVILGPELPVMKKAGHLQCPARISRKTRISRRSAAPPVSAPVRRHPRDASLGPCAIILLREQAVAVRSPCA